MAKAKTKKALIRYNISFNGMSKRQVNLLYDILKGSAPNKHDSVLRSILFDEVVNQVEWQTNNARNG